MGHTVRAIALLLSFVTSVASAAVVPHRLPPREDLRAAGQQFIQADSEGRVFLLRAAQDLSVFPVLRSHELGSPVRLAGGGAADLRDASMSGGREWLLLRGGDIVRASTDESLTAPTLEWLPLAVGFVDGEAMAIVSASRMKRLSSGEPSTAAPFLARWSGDDWVSELADLATARPADPGAAISDRAASLFSDRNGRYYLARQYVYRIEERRRAKEAPLAVLEVGNGKMVERPARPGEEPALAERAKPTTGARVGVFRGLDALLAMAKNPDGKLLALTGAAVAGEGPCGLDRIDWERRRVERLALDFACSGRVSLASGKDGLYVAPFSAKEDRYFIAWDELDRARWTPVAEAKFTD
jgi:hypothetical protein